jgi:PAS domain S-box-containing protein
MSAPFNNRILVIDDNAAIHEDFKKILVQKTVDADIASAEAMLFEESGPKHAQTSFEVHSAFQGKEGLEMVQKALEAGRPYAMAFVDVRMPPGWDGIETIGRIWKVYPDLQVVLCTAYSDYTWEQITATLGRSDSILILKKPFDNIEVLQLAHSLTNKWLLTQQARLHVGDLEAMVHERTAALQFSEERFSKAFKASPIPMTILKVGREEFVDVNDSFLAMTGYTREEVIGQTTASLNLWEDKDNRISLPEVLASGHPVRNRECPIRAKSGKRRDTLASVETFNPGVEPHALVITQDISDLLSLEHQLRQSQKMEAVGQLAAGIAHDFNNLLTVIQGHTTMRLAAPDLTAALAGSLQQIQAAADRASALTRQLLAFSRKQMIQPKPLNLNHLVEHLMQMLQSVLGEHISLHTDCAKALPLISGDPCNIEQVILNLVVNARDAMPNGGALTLRTTLMETDAAYVQRNPEAQQGRFACLTITDQGCGMDTTIRSRIFEPFFTTKEVGKGTGMGLATVYGIVKQHRGWIEVESQVNRGTTFRVYLPVTDQQVEEPAFEPTVVKPLRGGQETILMVEDEPVLRELVEAVLTDQGYRVLAAESGSDALRVWKEHAGAIDLLFTDMVMPGGMTGRELAQQLKPRDPKLKVIYTSGYSKETMDRSFALREGLNFLAKPYRPPALVQMVRNILDAPEAGTAFVEQPAAAAAAA